MYGDMSWISSTNIAYSIEKCLRQSTTDLDTAFQKAIDMCPQIPFHYFAKEIICVKECVAFWIAVKRKRAGARVYKINAVFFFNKGYVEMPVENAVALF